MYDGYVTTGDRYRLCLKKEKCVDVIDEWKEGKAVEEEGRMICVSG